MNKLNKILIRLGQRQLLLNSVLIIFLTLSAVTTYLGATLVLNFDNQTLQFAVCAGLAIGLSLLLLFLSKSISSFINSLLGGVFLIFSYTMVALLSVFFNFQTFYINLNKKSDLDKNIVEFRRIINSISSKGYVENLALSSLADSVSLYKAEMDFELANTENPGQGPKYLAAEGKYIRFSSLLNDNRKKFSSVFESIVIYRNDAIKYLDSIQLNQGKNKHVEQANLLSKVQDKHSNICAEISSLNDHFICPQLIVEKKDITSSLQVFMDIFGGEKVFSSREKASIGLSVFLAAILDFPIFLLLISIELVSQNHKTSHSTGRKRKNNGVGRFEQKNRRIFDVKDLFNR